MIDCEFTETEGRVSVQAAFVSPDGLPPESADPAQILKALEIAKDSVIQQIPLVPRSVAEGKPRILVPR